MIESPYAGNVAANRTYLQLCIIDSIYRGEAPFASHQMYTYALDDDDPGDRHLGISAGYAFWPAAKRIIFYTDKGWSLGMRVALERARTMGKPYEIRSISSHV